jgi:hypothetical protein
VSAGNEPARPAEGTVRLPRRLLVRAVLVAAGGVAGAAWALHHAVSGATGKG